MPYVNPAYANEAIARGGVQAADERIYRCPTDISTPRPFLQPDATTDGISNRTSYLMNSLLSHKTRRYGRWTFPRFQSEIGSSNVIAFSERDPRPPQRRCPGRHRPPPGRLRHLARDGRPGHVDPLEAPRPGERPLPRRPCPTRRPDAGAAGDVSGGTVLHAVALLPVKDRVGTRTGREASLPARTEDRTLHPGARSDDGREDTADGSGLTHQSRDCPRFPLRAGSTSDPRIGSTLFRRWDVDPSLRAQSRRLAEDDEVYYLDTGIDLAFFYQPEGTTVTILDLARPSWLHKFAVRSEPARP